MPVLHKASSYWAALFLAAYSYIIIMRKKLLLVILIIPGTSLFVEGQQNDGYLLWSASHKLSVDDFAIKTQQVETTPSFGQFTVDYQVNGFDFLTRNFNKRVRNYFIRSASWIDTSINVNQSLTYQQTLFDICEVYARRFRKALRENRSKILKGTT